MLQPEDLRARGAQRLRGADLVRRDGRDTGRRVQDHDEDRRVDDEEDLRRLADPEPDHGHRDHGDGRDEAQELRVGLQELAHRPERAHGQADRNAQQRNFGGDYFPVSEQLVLGMVERFQRDRQRRRRGIVLLALEEGREL